MGGRVIEVAAPGDHDAAPGAIGEIDGVREVRVAADAMAKGAAAVDCRIVSNPAAQLWRRVIETVSQSEAGFERSYQGTSLSFGWVAEVGTGRTLQASLTLRMANV